MPRLRTAILPLFTALVVPAFGETATTSCQAWNASYCDAEFAQARNTEIDVSLAAVKLARERTFVAARNAEIEASIAAVTMARLQPPSRSSCESADPSPSPCEGEIAANFARERNAQIELSLAAVKVARERAFADARNAEIEASIAATKTARLQPRRAARAARAPMRACRPAWARSPPTSPRRATPRSSFRWPP